MKAGDRVKSSHDFPQGDMPSKSADYCYQLRSSQKIMFVSSYPSSYPIFALFIPTFVGICGPVGIKNEEQRK